MQKLICHLRALFLVPFIAIHTLVCSVFVISILLLRVPRKIVDFAIRNIWCRIMLTFCGINLKVSGSENVPKDTGFLYLFTHSSHLDIPVLFVASPKSFRFGSKASLFKVPFFGLAMRLSGTLPITREDRSKVIEVYREAEARVAKGEAFALAPEGGRRIGDEILDFKSGPFMFAINAKMPIVPIVLSGVDRVLPKKTLMINKDRWSRDVGVHFLPAIETKDIPLEDVKKLKENVRGQVVEVFEKMKKTYH